MAYLWISARVVGSGVRRSARSCAASDVDSIWLAASAGASVP
jgi:hypothetical protein